MTRSSGANEQLRRSRAQDTTNRIARCEAALERLVALGEPISVTAVARAAGVGDKFPFRHNELKAKIDNAIATINTTARPALDAALIAERDHWKTEAAKLSTQLQRALQRVIELDGNRVSIDRGLIPPTDERDALRAETTRLSNELDLLQHRLDDQATEVAAVRRMNRDLVRENNRLRQIAD